MSSSRTASYSLEEDMHLCHVYIDISQDPIIGRNQSGNSFWARVESEYHKNEKFSNQPRPRRSLQTRMTTIIGAIAKLRGCINQIQNKNPSGASQEDILNQAKMLLAQEKKYSRGFKFDHVWPILKHIQKFTSDDNINGPSRFQQDGPNFTSSKSSSHNFDSPTSASTGMSSFDLNINNEEIITNSTERPIGVKKAKAKQLGDDQFNKLMEQSKKLIQVIEKSNTDRNERHKRKTEDKILFTDLDSISDPEFLQYIQSERRRIYRERARTSEVGEQGE
ncbi:glutathione S-transferase T3-like [Humulus lupulus]|uniref:glutathione S-transferase T3-like n=1 Tax=Humulus lupulus TaxID=3486 RepID=UPI002B4125CC|nr:glutathione S-transferase T3-like [Humulus lupulus]